MRCVAAAVLAATLIVSSASAQTAAPLAVGKPAGVQKAEFFTSGTGLALLSFGALLGIGVGLMSGTTRETGATSPIVAPVATSTSP